MFLTEHELLVEYYMKHKTKHKRYIDYAITKHVPNGT
jgi:hypothetical protein